jgi:hypothetical protein
MNAAEITEKLGLHSLRQRAWVCYRIRILTHGRRHADGICSTFNPLALPLVMVSTRVLSGSRTPSASLVTPKKIWTDIASEKADLLSHASLHGHS